MKDSTTTAWRSRIRKPDAESLTTKPKTSSGNKANAVPYVPGTKGNVAFVKKTLKSIGATKPYHQHVLAHLINARLVDDSWHIAKPTPIPYYVWEKLAGRSNAAKAWEPFKAAGILKVNGHSHQAGICRTFLLTDEFMEDYYTSTMDCGGDFQTYNIVNSKRVKRRLKTRLKDENNHAVFENDVCQAALKDSVNRPCHFDRDKVLAELDLMVKLANESRLPIDRNRARIAVKCVSTIMTGAGQRQGWYIPALVGTVPGRIHEIGGGLQAAPDRIKWAAWQGMIDKGIATNYDLSCSQLRILLRIANALNTRERGKQGLVNAPNDRAKIKALAKRYNYDLSHHNLPPIDVGLLRRFVDLNDNSFRKEIERRLMDAGVPCDSVKRVIYGMVMGMKREGFYEIFGEKFSPGKRDDRIEAIYKEVGEILSWLTDVIEHISDRLMLTLRFFLTHRKGFGQCYLGMPDIAQLIKVTSHIKGIYIANACDRKVHILNPYGDWVRDSKKEWYMGRVMAHILQGAEAYYIAHITLLQKEGNFEVQSNEHDGLMVLGKIPKWCQDLAAKRSGLGNAAVLVEKPFNRFKVEPGRVVTGGKKETPRSGSRSSLPSGASNTITQDDIGCADWQIQVESHEKYGGEL